VAEVWTVSAGLCAARALAEPSFSDLRRELARRAQPQSKLPSRPKLVPVCVVADAMLEVVSETKSWEVATGKLLWNVEGVHLPAAHRRHSRGSHRLLDA
jgi:hypothetical protein